MNLFGDVYRGRRVLVTGHTGFKGSWLVLWLYTLGAEVAGLALDPDTQPSHWTLLALDDVEDHRVDLRDAAAVRRIIDAHRPEIIFHLAAQPLVRRSYRDPVETFVTNVTGLINLLEAVRGCASARVFVNVTTDKVYAESDAADGYRETDPLGGHDPYSTSKACSELVSDCYRKSYFGGDAATVRLATARAGNVIGGGDWADDRLVPDLVRAANAHQPLSVRNPNATRPWQHVLEPLSGYLRLGQMLWTGQGFDRAWNFGPGRKSEITVQALIARMQTHWPELHVTHDTSEQPHEAAQLRLATDMARDELGWRPIWDTDTTIARTADWYRGFHEHGTIDSREDLAHYVAEARNQQASWAT